MMSRPIGLAIDRPPPGYCFNGTLIGVPPSVRALVGVTCILSMAGAILIILSYILIREIRTTIRKILLHLSIMDFMVAAGHSIGVFINFDRYFVTNNVSSPVHGACEAQAFFSMYCTISSILWTNCMAVYIYLYVMQVPKVAWSMYAFYALNYGLPLITSLWFLLTKRLGYSPYGGSGWCSVILETGQTPPFVIVLAYDVWIYLTVIVVPLIYISLKLKSINGTAQKIEKKLLLIPVFFILLRMWSLLQSIIQIEAGVKLNCTTLLFFVHIGGIGDSGQGFANAILFVIFTPKVRRYFLHRLFCSSSCCKARTRRPIIINSNIRFYYRAVQSPSSEHSGTDDALSKNTEIYPHNVLVDHNT